MKRLSMTIFFVLCAGAAYCGTTAIEFSAGTGNLVRRNPDAPGGALTTDSECRGVLSSDIDEEATWYIGDGASPAVSTGVTTVTVGLAPAVDLEADGGLNPPSSFAVFIAPHQGSPGLSIAVDQAGEVSMSGGLQGLVQADFPDSAATGNTFTVTYDQFTDTATLIVSGVAMPLTINQVFTDGLGDPGPPLIVGIHRSAGEGDVKLRSLVVSGSGIPDLTSAGLCGNEAAPEIIGGGVIEVGNRLSLSLLNAEDAIGLQWTRNGIDLPGEMGATLVRDPVGAGDAGFYRCRVDYGIKAVVQTVPASVEVIPQGSLPVGGAVPVAIALVALSDFGSRATRRAR